MQGCCSLVNKAQKQAACRDDAITEADIKSRWGVDLRAQDIMAA